MDGKISFFELKLIFARNDKMNRLAGFAFHFDGEGDDE